MTEAVHHEAAVDPGRLGVLLDRIKQAVVETPLPSMQVAVARHGRLVAFDTFGAATGRDRYVLQSVGRSIVAGVVWHLIGAGRLDIRERVAEIVPEFGANGKDTVTVEHVLTHTAGFPFAPLGYPKMLSREQRLAAFARWRLDYPPGSRLQFHLTSAAWLIGEIVHRRTGLTFAEYLRAELTGPLGLSSVDLGVPADTVLPMIATDRTGDDQEPDPWGPWYLSDPRVLAAGEPSHALVGTAADVALFFQALVHSGRWTPGAVAEGSRIRLTQRPAGEEAYGGGTPVSMGLFVTVAGGGLPSTGSPALFGNSGAAYQLGFLDPVSGVSFALLCNGYPLAGYDLSTRGKAMMSTIADLAANLT
ncbi:beta-lactamase family protein [Amycolatopsis sp. H6(2020)]|nr:beta-lactamase family protein [Amycolatopsis sp. H6(2020)]